MDESKYHSRTECDTLSSRKTAVCGSMGLGSIPAFRVFQIQKNISSNIHSQCKMSKNNVGNVDCGNSSFRCRGRKSDFKNLQNVGSRTLRTLNRKQFF